MGRPPIAEIIEKPKRGPWTPNEDILLVSYIQEHGPENWRLVPRKAGLQRCGKSCSLRWKNYLRPGIKRGSFTSEEDMIIIRYQALLGNRWAAIATHLPSRTYNDIKNYWHMHLKKKLGERKNSGGEREKNNKDDKHNEDVAIAGGLDHTKAYYNKMYKNDSPRYSMTATPPNTKDKESIYDYSGIPTLASIEKWLLEDLSTQVPPDQAPAPVPQVPYALAPNPQGPHDLVSWVPPTMAPTHVPQVRPTLTHIVIPQVPSALTHTVVPIVPLGHAPQVPSILTPTHVPRVPSTPAPSASPGHDDHDRILNKITHFIYDQFSFGLFY